MTPDPDLPEGVRDNCYLCTDETPCRWHESSASRMQAVREAFGKRTVRAVDTVDFLQASIAELFQMFPDEFAAALQRTNRVSLGKLFDKQMRLPEFEPPDLVRLASIALAMAVVNSTDTYDDGEG